MDSVNCIGIAKNRIEEGVSAWLAAQGNQGMVDTSQFKFETPPDDRLGHIAFACFPLARVMKRSPAIIAQQLRDHWMPSAYFEKVEAEGPYLNFFLHPRYLAAELLPHCIGNDRYGDSEIGAGRTLMLEFSSPNTNKPLHLGHGRNNLLGFVLDRLLKCCGYRVIKANLVNDRGIHICKSMLAYQRWGQDETPGSTGIKGDKLVGRYYVLYDRKEKEDPTLVEDTRQMLRRWEAGDETTLKLWERLNGWVLDGFRQTYERMGVSFDRYYFESETYAGGREIVLEALGKGLCNREENGAVAIDLSSAQLGRKILLRGDGTSMYITQDINTTVTKFRDYPLDGCLFVVGSEQENHFRVLFAILKRFGFEWAGRCEHISYGMITLPEGRMKSREGTVVDLDDLMDEMKTLALEEIRSRHENEPETAGLDPQTTAEAIGQAAIRFFILRTNALKEITFNPKESLSFDGATGPYLQYTHARICSVLRKAEPQIESADTLAHRWNSAEIRLMVQMARLPDVIEAAATERNPALLCGYVYDLCRHFNKFYYDCPILKADDLATIKARIELTMAVRGVLQKSLKILGIDPLERM
jgi:arginyl-tRNA synthetase